MGQAGILHAGAGIETDAAGDDAVSPRPDGGNDPSSTAAVDAAERRSRRYLAGVMVLQVACLGLVLSRTYFEGDDVMLFAQVREQGFGYDYLRLHLFGHFSPGHRLVDWVAFQLGPMAWWPAALIVSGQLLLASLLLHRTVRFLAPDAAWPTLLIGLFATSPLVMGSAMWWAAAGQYVPATVFSLLAVLAALHYNRRPRWTMALGFAGALVTALLFQEKAVVVPLGIAALLWATQERGDLRTTWTTARRCVPLVAISAGALALFAAAIKLGRYNEATPHPSLRTWWDWAVELFRAGPFAGVVGVSPNHFSGADRALLLWAAGLTVLGVVVWSSVRFRGAWRAWAFLAVAFLPAISLTAYGRAATYGPGVAGDFHYPGELAYLAVIAATVAFTRPARRAERAPRVRDSRLALALVPMIALSFISGVRYADRFPTDDSRRFFANLRDYDGGDDLPVLNTAAPAGVISSDLAPYNCVATLLDLVPATRDLAIATPADDEALVVHPDGRLTAVGSDELDQFLAMDDPCLTQ